MAFMDDTVRINGVLGPEASLPFLSLSTSGVQVLSPLLEQIAVGPTDGTAGVVVRNAAPTEDAKLLLDANNQAGVAELKVLASGNCELNAQSQFISLNTTTVIFGSGFVNLSDRALKENVRAIPEEELQQTFDAVERQLYDRADRWDIEVHNVAKARGGEASVLWADFTELQVKVEEDHFPLLLDSDEPVLGFGSVCHRRSQSLQVLGLMEVWRTVICVCLTLVSNTSPAPRIRQENAVRVWVGDRFEEQERVGGSEKVDGFFAAFRKVVGKRPFHTVGSSDDRGPRMEQIMRFHVRLFQLKHWFGGQDMFS
ncbi:unnamed protein product, partial [Symbiodinium sp. CCMP2592]